MTASQPPQSGQTLFATRPLVIGALHLPDLAVARDTRPAALEDYVLANAGAFFEGGIRALMLQDATRSPGPAAPETLALMGALGHALRNAYPALQVGIIVQAHDHAAALAIAHAIGAGFVRLKVFVGGVMGATGPRDALGPRARAYRHELRRDDIAILADVHDRTSVPRDDVPHEQAALWAQQLGADALILTGASFEDSLGRVRAARQAGVKRPLLIGGGVTERNIADALRIADGVIVSSSLMTTGGEPLGIRWDREAIARLMTAAGPPSGTA